MSKSEDFREKLRELRKESDVLSNLKKKLLHLKFNFLLQSLNSLHPRCWFASIQ